MADRTSLSLLSHFTTLPDPRVPRTRRHELLDSIAIALCAVICGAKSWENVETYGQSKRAWLATFLKLPNGIPSHDTFNRVFARLDPHAFQQSFASWMRAVWGALGLRAIAIDGKTLRHSFDTSSAQAALHLVSAWAADNHLTLGQVAVDTKSNEITAIPKLLEILDVAGAIVTIDAMGCQKEIAAKIRENGADYILAVKDNQPRLYEDVMTAITTHLDNDFAGVEHSFHEEVSRGHGRVERRTVLVIHSTAGIRDAALWPDLSTICLVVGERTAGGRTRSAARHYIGSRVGTGAAYASSIRGHWGIENSLHWVLDVTFREDDSRLRTGHGPENLAMLRRIAVSLLKRETSSKESIQGKSLRAGWDDEFLEAILQHFPEE